MIKKLRSQWVGLFTLTLATLIAIREHTYLPVYTVLEEPTFLDPVGSFQDSLEYPLDNASSSKKQTVYVEAVKSLPSGFREITKVLTKGDTLHSLLKKLDISPKQVDDVVKSMKKVCNLKEFKSGQKIHIKTETQDNKIQLIHLEFRPNLESIISLDKTYKGFVSRKDPIKLKRVLKRAVGAVKAGFQSSAVKSGVPKNLVKEVINTLGHTVNFQKSVKSGDPFEILYETFVNPEGETVKIGKLLYAAFAAGGQVHTLYNHASPQGQWSYYNAKGESLKHTLLQTPLGTAKIRITSKFGLRMHPFRGFNALHKGIDLGAKTGTPVIAAGPGVVIKAVYNGNYGNYVHIKHQGNYETAYAHLQKIAPGIKPGTFVKQGQQIGVVGQTGSATGPHLHFEVLKCGVQINPLSVKMLPSTKLSGKETQRFQRTKREVHAHVAGIVPQSRYAQTALKNLG